MGFTVTSSCTLIDDDAPPKKRARVTSPASQEATAEQPSDTSQGKNKVKIRVKIYD